MPRKNRYHPLAPEEWVQIKTDFDSGEYTLKELAEKWDVSTASITTTRSREGWINRATGEPYKMTARQKAAAEKIPKGEQAAELTQTEADQRLNEIAAQLTAPDDESDLARVQRELEETKAELAAYKPVEVEWIVDYDTAAGMLSSELGDRVQMELQAINDTRLKRGLPYYTVEQMDADRPGWSASIREQIIQSTVDDLSRWSTDSGPSLHKIMMLRPDGKTKEQIPFGPNIDSGRRPDMLRARGWRDVSPQPCRRWNCYLMPPDGDPYEGFHSALHRALFDWQYPEVDSGVTTSSVFEG